MRPFLVLLALLTASPTPVPSSQRATMAVAEATPRVEAWLGEQDLTLGAPVFLRILKEEERLEAFVRGADGRFVLARTWPICAFSGVLGPKTKRGDRQAPEGFYFVPPGRMNPASRFHLSFDLGYPNAFDRAHGRTGDFLMVHGDCVSIGCYAMTDPVIEELWVLLDAAFRAGQPFVRVHAFPFAMTPENRERHAGSPHDDFWAQLAAGWEAFERTGVPPNVEVEAGRYVIQERSANQERSADP